MHPLAWVCVGIALGVAINPGAEVLTNPLAHQPLLYPQES